MKAQIVRLRQQLRGDLLALARSRDRARKADRCSCGSWRAARASCAAISSFSASSILPVGSRWKTCAVGILVIGDGAFAGLPRGHSAKQHAVPIQIEEAFAIVVPYGGERAGRAQPLPVANKSLNVPERSFGHGIDLVPIRVAGRNPGFDAVLGEGLDQLVEAARESQ